MQRTVNGTKFTYVKNTINKDGTITAELATYTVNETDEKKAYKAAAKIIGNFAAVKTEKVSKLYILDDEIFFKYAVPVEDKENTDEVEG